MDQFTSSDRFYYLGIDEFGLVVTGSGGGPPPVLSAPATVGLAPEQLSLSAGDLSPRLVFTIQNAWVFSARSLYGCKWRVFEECSSRNDHIPFQYSVGVIFFDYCRSI